MNRLEGVVEPIKGPSALGNDPRRFWNLTRTLAVTDFKLRFFGSALGYLWQLMRPLLQFSVLYILFTQILPLDDTPYFGEALLLSLVLFTFFSDATKGAVQSLIVRENLVRKIEFPRLAVPLAISLTAMFNLALNLLPVFIFFLVDGGTPRWTWLELPILIVLLAALATGIGMLLSALFVRYRDIDPIWEIVLQLLFYGTPIFYTITVVADASAGVAKGMMLNPFAAISQQARYALLGPGHPSAGAAIGGWERLAIPVGISLGLLVLGYWVFSRRAPRIAEEL